MFVVPVKNDKIKTKDDSNPRVVSSYTSLKDEPAVYLTADSSQDRYLYFSDIIEINGVAVEYDSTSKTFNALGPLKRKYNIPQPGDTITIKLQDVNYKDETEEIELDSVKLHNKKHGTGRGLLVCGSKSCFALTDILNLKRKSWTETFNASKFQKYYFDYLPMNIRIKS